MNKKRWPVIMVIAVATMLVLASSCTAPTNHEPVIDSLEAEAEWVAPLGSL